LRDLRIRVADELTIEHDGGLGDRLYLRLGSLLPIRIALPTGGIIRLPLPDAALPPDLDNPLPRPIPPGGELQPGTLEIALIAEAETQAIEGALDRGLPVPVTRALRSNSALLQLAPSVAALSAANGTAADVLTITGTRLFAETLVCEVLIGEAIIPIRPPEPGEPFAAPTPTAVEIPVAALAALVAPGPALLPVAVQVNGVRSIETGFTFRLDP
jgi:hypothetical protein